MIGASIVGDAVVSFGGGGSRPGLGFGEEMFNRLLSAEKLGFG